MRFAFCLMNPPYDKNLHLKFLEKTIQVADKVVSVQPIDCFVNMNVSTKLSDKISNYIDDIYKISAADANKLFSILSSSNIGIIYAYDGAKGYKYDNDNMHKYVDKIRKIKSIRSSINYYLDRDNAVEYNNIVTIQGDYGYAKSWHYTLSEIFNGKPNAAIGFNTQKEADNFILSVKTTWPYKLMYIIDDNSAVIAHLPFMGDYNEPWTDDRFYTYFGITDKEKAEIHKFIDDNYGKVK